MQEFEQKVLRDHDQKQAFRPSPALPLHSFGFGFRGITNWLHIALWNYAIKFNLNYSY